jgi:3-phenylpropionate/trans-cinnamate dioxygenase ferredoxin subunit
MMAQNALVWHKIAEHINLINWQPNQLALVEVAGKTITLIQYKEQVLACAHKCPHAGAVMADGYIDATGQIVCPLHRYRFSLQNGRNTSGEGYFLKTYPIELREDGIFLGLAPNSLFNW